MNIAHGSTDLIGHTPLLELCRYEEAHGLPAVVLAKLERANPAGSSKDRVAAHMIACAEAEGRLFPGGTIIEPTSGNTGIGLAAVGAAKGYRVILTMPDTMSVERRNLIAAYGAQIVLTPGAEGMSGAVAKAEELQREIPGSIIAGQFENPANPAAHEVSTGPEIWADTEGKVDIFVAGAGTGGTLTGTGRESRAVRGSRFSLSRRQETIYVAELLEPSSTWEFGVTEDEVRAAFSLIAAEWVTGDN